MTELSKEILARFQVRKTKKQKTEFIRFLEERLLGLRVEEGGSLHSRNLLLGDLSSAKVVFSAHYDTCAEMFFPNFLTPKNIPIYVLFNLVLCVFFFAAAFVTAFVVMRLTHVFLLARLSAIVVVLFLCCFLFMGKANPHTVNDNTSGVLTLCEIYASLSEEQRKKALFVFFDHEELGMIGSSFFRKLHKAEMKDKLLINFDCVSDGNNILLIENKAAREKWEEALQKAFPQPAGKQVRLERSSSTLYPSDQMGFPCYVAVAAFRRSRIFGLYLSRIHTKRDTVLQEENIQYLVSCAGDLLSSL